MFTTFIYSLAGGMLGVLATGPPGQIAWRFLRLAGILTFALLCIVTVWHLAGRGSGDPPARIVALGAAAAVLTIGVVLAAPWADRGPRAFQAMAAVAGALALVAAVLSAVRLPGGDPGVRAYQAVVIGVHQVAAAALLGSITVAWLLGHAYLTATRMTIAPLRHFSRMLSWSAGARIVLAAVGLGLLWVIPTAGGGSAVWVQLGRAWLIVSLRVGVGLVAVAVFAYMVRDCVRLRSTQSATGILYFGSVFAYIGELASLHLLATCGWPL